MAPQNNDKPSGADTRADVAAQAAAALSKLGLGSPSPRNAGYDGSLNEPGATPPSTSITDRIARLRRSLSDEKVKNQGSKFSLSSLRGRAKEVVDRAAKGYADLDGGYGELRSDKRRTAADQAEHDLDRANDRRMRRADRRQQKRDAEEAKDPVRGTNTTGYVGMHSLDDAPSPTSKLGQAKDKLLRTGTLFAASITKAARALEARVKKKPAEKVDERACSGGGRVAASTYVARAHIQFDTVSPDAVLGQIAAAQTLATGGGLWALKARYVAATKAVPGQLRAARDAEERAGWLADTLQQANERFETLKAQESLLRALVDEARQLSVAQKPANGLLASFPAGAPPPAALDASPVSSRASRASPAASVGSPAASHNSDAPATPVAPPVLDASSRASSSAASLASDAAAEPVAAASASAAAPAGAGTSDEEAGSAPAEAAPEEPPPVPEPAADAGMPSWMAQEATTTEEASTPPAAPPTEPSEDEEETLRPVTPDEENSPAFTDEEDDKPPDEA